MAGPPGESSASVRKRVITARQVMSDRFGGSRTNSTATTFDLASFEVEPAAGKLLAEAHHSQGMSGRAHDRVLRLARTVADLADSNPIEEAHIAAALQFRRREAK